MPAPSVALLCAAQRPTGAQATRRAQRCVRLAHLAARPPAPAAPALRQPSPRRLQALPGISENIDDETRSELPGYLTLAAYAAQELAKRGQLGFQLTGPLIFKALAWYTLASALLAALDVQGPGLQDRVGGFVGPAFLAVNFLGGLGGLLSPFEAAAAGFGVLLADALPAFAYSRWVWLATLAAAIYSGLASQWLVGAFGLGSLWKLLNQLQGGGGVRPQNAAFAALAAWALYAKPTQLVALAVMAGHMAAEVVS
ncbi:2-dehydropantoate 2-reductase [Chlorella sorokiniana]|uniref:2-dehydropantoate 2-reductase n=1 Tax=Chlorella sorokiniana TaxID=3076 RepID=A0A2P6TFP4_CHLSO|nr:2-dehydropantoate 2-reductase [Chlorella sorokiniana]|eukprot:PRW32919.1 2-dehydropantoate 2-reductase [Chlorella sorokiniana]